MSGGSYDYASYKIDEWAMQVACSGEVMGEAEWKEKRAKLEKLAANYLKEYEHYEDAALYEYRQYERILGELDALEAQWDGATKEAGR